MSITCPACLMENSDNEIICVSCGNQLSSTSGNTHHLPPGTSLKQGRFKIDKTLGAGGFGITYKGTDSTNSLGVAIKELWPENAMRQGSTVTWSNSITPQVKKQQLSKFQLEAEYLSKCVHPNIAKVYDWFEENNTAYIVMEFISGKSLYDVWKEEQPLLEDRVKRYMIAIAESLKAVHANNLLHRDIKPENIIIDSQDRAVLIDFGATREFISSQTTSMTRLLTPGYAPLEQYSAKGKRYPATDIYALSASIYELLTGIPPVEAIERMASETLIPPRQLRPELSSLIEQVILIGMRVKVEERFQTADELLDALQGRFVSPLHKKAQDLVKQGKLTEVVQAYEKCLVNEPNNGDAAVELSLVLIHLNDAKTEGAAQKAIQLKPNDGRGYGILGLINCRKSNWSEAVRQLQQAATISSQESWIQANLAWAWGMTGNWQQAEMAIDRALQMDSESAFALGLKGWIALNQEEWKSTIRYSRQAIFRSKQANSHSDQKLQAWVYPCLTIALDKAIVTKQSRDVERCLQEFMTQIPDHSFAWGFTGWQQSIQGLWADAVTSFDQAMSKGQASSWVLENLGIASENLHNIPKAIQSYEACQQKFPATAFIQFRLGTLLGKQGQWQSAQSFLEKAIQLKPDYAEAHHNLGWVLFNSKDQNGEVANFRSMWSAYRRAIELYSQQQKHDLAQAIKQSFQAIGSEI